MEGSVLYKVIPWLSIILPKCIYLLLYILWCPSIFLDVYSQGSTTSVAISWLQLHDERSVIGRGLFKKETNMQPFVGLRVQLSTGQQSLHTPTSFLGGTV